MTAQRQQRGERLVPVKILAEERRKRQAIEGDYDELSKDADELYDALDGCVALLKSFNVRGPAAKKAEDLLERLSD